MKTERRGRPKKQVEIVSFDSTKVKTLGNPVMDNAPAVMKVCEELLKHL